MKQNTRPGWSNMDASGDNSEGIIRMLKDITSLLASIGKAAAGLLGKKKNLSTIMY